MSENKISIDFSKKKKVHDKISKQDPVKNPPCFMCMYNSLS